MSSYEYWKDQIKQTSDNCSSLSFYKNSLPQYNELIEEAIKNLNEMGVIAEEIFADLGPSLDDEQYTSVAEMNLSETYANLHASTNTLLEEISDISQKEYSKLEENLEKASNDEVNAIHEKMHGISHMQYLYLT